VWFKAETYMKIILNAIALFPKATIVTYTGRENDAPRC